MATIRFDGTLMAQDVALRGWLPIDLARRANVSDMAVYRFLSGDVQTAPMAKKLARALGYRTAKRYLLPLQDEAVA
jgi:transcriptional regulator with XRE-family HTH domain